MLTLIPFNILDLIANFWFLFHSNDVAIIQSFEKSMNFYHSTKIEIRRNSPANNECKC